MTFMEYSINTNRVNLVGLDEVGRGPIAGPVVACGVSFTGSRKLLKDHLEYFKELNVTDSKKLNHAKRIQILNEVMKEGTFDHKNIALLKSYSFKEELEGLRFCLSAKDNKEIEKLNILWASMEAMGECAYLLVDNDESIIWIDGNKSPKNLPDNVKVKTIIKGDELSMTIGLASIVAKVYRDQLMNDYHKSYPEFGFDSNAGYPTPSHKKALLDFGKTPIHRNSFKSVSEVKLKYVKK